MYIYLLDSMYNMSVVVWTVHCVLSSRLNLEENWSVCSGGLEG